jgi:hypothetical protein
MAPDAAFALLLLGLAGSLLHSNKSAKTRRLFACVIGSFAISIGVEIAVTYALGIQLPLDQFFFPHDAVPFPWRRSPPTAIALISARQFSFSTGVVRSALALHNGSSCAQELSR